MLAEAHDLVTEGRLYQALRALQIIRDRFLAPPPPPPPSSSSSSTLQQQQPYQQMNNNSSSNNERALSSAQASTSGGNGGGGGGGGGSSSVSIPPPSQLISEFGPMRRILERHVQKMVEEVDRQSLQMFHEWMVAARQEARSIGLLAMQAELEGLDENDRVRTCSIFLFLSLFTQASWDFLYT
jgi:hypothetical protein